MSFILERRTNELLKTIFLILKPSPCVQDQSTEIILDSSLGTCQKPDGANKAFSSYNTSTVSSQGDKVH